jgi:hypothetical protein
MKAAFGTIGVALLVRSSARSYGRTVAFAFGVNWILIVWAIWLGGVLESRRGAWDGISSRAEHLVIFVVILGITRWAFLSREWNAVASLLLFNVSHNAFPWCL